MTAIWDWGFEFYNQTNFTAVQGGRYAIRTTEGVGLTMTLPANAVNGTTVEAIYAYGTGSFAVQGNGKNIYSDGNPYGGDYSNVGSITFDGDLWRGFYFVFVCDGISWTVGLGQAQPQGVKFRDYIQLVDAEIYSDAPTSSNGVETKPHYFRTSDGRNMADIRGYKSGYNIANEAGLRFSTSNGGWSYQQAMAFEIASPPRVYVNGELSAGSVTNRSDADLKDDEQPLNPAWIDALLALQIRTYMMGDPDLPPSEDYPEGRKNPGRRRHVGFFAQDLQALAPADQATATVFQHRPDQPREVDLMSLIALLIKTTQHLHQRIAALEANQ